MKVSINASIYELQTAFWRSDGCVAVVDENNVLKGLFGIKENFITTTKITEGYEKIDSIKDLINKNYSFITMSEKINYDVKNFFEKYPYAHVPIVSSKGEFIRFEKNKQLCNEISESNMLKRIIAERWFIYDKFEDRFDSCEIKCVICDGNINTRIAEKKICSCLFGGGRLIRYICPHCGAIIGPLKMLTLSEAELAEDYMQHYLVYQEGETTEDEINTFFKLNPQKGKKYLNYGCGGEWSKSIKNLREMGYEVYGYEPFAAPSSVDYIITEREKIEKLKFDGIFSNNLIEHLRNPIEELKFMKSLLNDSNALMAHSTACYEYLYPYTRFHVCFPVGKSAERMFERAGLQQIKRCEEILHGDKQICVLVQVKEE